MYRLGGIHHRCLARRGLQLASHPVPHGDCLASDRLDHAGVPQSADADARPRAAPTGAAARPTTPYTPRLAVAGGAAAAVSLGAASLEADRTVTLGRAKSSVLRSQPRRRRFGGGGLTVAGGWTVSPHAGTRSGSPVQTGRNGGVDVARCSATTTTIGHAHAMKYGRYRCPDDGDETHRGRRRIP
jgi:hypothetical protein